MSATTRPASKLVPALFICGIGVLALLATGGAETPAANAAAPEPFGSWPKDVKPDAVLVITGQTYGYLQPCGCSRPQLGGLERRAQFIAALKAKGWPVAAVDVGDILPVAGIVPEQVLLKYATTLPALREMGYIAVGVGKAEFANGLFQVLDQYAARKEQPPYALAGNVGGLVGGKLTPRVDAFIGPGKRAMVELIEVADVGTTPVGVAGVVGPSVQKAVTAMGPKTLVGFTAEKDALATAVKEFAAHPKKPRANVLLYQGTLDEAKALAKDWQQFPIIVCLSPDAPPPVKPETVAGVDGQKTLIIQVGQKGRSVGVLGAFKRADGSFDWKYELVPMSEAFVTPGDEDAARKTNPVLSFLDDYATQVKSRNLLGKFPEGPPPALAQDPNLNLAYVGSESCVKCHTAESAKWKETAHSHAFEALERIAKRPSLRQFDGECVICHTVGLGYKTGFRDEIASPNLKNVGCESCHGPGSGHIAEPKSAKYLALQAPWRKDQTDRLPDPATIAALGMLTDAAFAKAPLKDSERRMIGGVKAMCMSCHDIENDPYFDFFTQWPKVHHAAKKEK